MKTSLVVSLFLTAMLLSTGCAGWVNRKDAEMNACKAQPGGGEMECITKVFGGAK